MGIFKPSNINKREYPGNANVIGPTTAASCSETSVYCCDSANVVAACTGPEPVLGCCGTYCFCPCCDACCRCYEYTRNPSVPSGMYTMKEQYCASTADQWGSSTIVTCGPKEFVSCTNPGQLSVSAAIGNCYGFYVGDSGGNKMFIAENSTEAQEVWRNTDPVSNWTAVSNATNNIGDYGWCIFSRTESSVAYSGRSYWDTYQSTSYYWTHTEFNGSRARNILMNNGATDYFLANGKTSSHYTRAIRMST